MYSSFIASKSDLSLSLSLSLSLRLERTRYVLHNISRTKHNIHMEQQSTIIQQEQNHRLTRMTDFHRPILCPRVLICRLKFAFAKPLLNFIDYDLISKFQVGVKSLLHHGLSEPKSYGDLVFKLKKIVGSFNFSAQFIKIISHYKKIGYNINVL